MPYPRLLLFGLAAFVLASGVHSQPPGGAAPAQAPRGRETQYAGAASCKACHSSPQLYLDALDLFTMREFPTWDQDDQHARAFKVLDGRLGKAMGERLAAAGHAEYAKPSAEWKACLTCHAIDLSLAEPNVAAKTFHTDDGVSCEACHGWADKWYPRHSNRRIWRDLTAAAKEADGLYDMRDAHRRAERCAACHVGSAAEGKVVTHEMYAAGHPPLPGLETVTFSLLQPAHFIPARTAKYFETPEGQKNAWERYHYRPDELPQTRQVALGAAVTFRAAVRLLKADAERAGPGKLLDFANFECAACHHDLQSPGWRQAPATSVPGRPPLSRWPAVLAEVAARHASEPDGEFSAKWRTLHDAATGRPFGDAKAVAVAASALDDWTGRAIDRLQAHKFTSTEAERLLRDLTARATAPNTPRGAHDYDSARQLAWAFAVVYREVGKKSEVIDGALAELDKLLDLTFRRPNEYKVSIRDQLAARLKAANGYDPVAFRAAFARIATALGQGP